MPLRHLKVPRLTSAIRRLAETYLAITLSRCTLPTLLDATLLHRAILLRTSGASIRHATPMRLEAIRCQRRTQDHTAHAVRRLTTPCPCLTLWNCTKPLLLPTSPYSAHALSGHAIPMQQILCYAFA